MPEETIKELERRIKKARQSRNAADDALKALVDLKAPGAKKEKKALVRELREVRGDRDKRVEQLKERKKDAKKDGADEAVEWAFKQLGKTESPPSSNTGGFPISECQEFTIGYDGVPYCGCFVAYAAAKIGGASFPELARLAYTPYIDYDAGMGRNGLKEVAAEDVRRGDFAVFHFGSGGAKHVGLCVGPVHNGTTDCVEGNTSAGTTGSQDDGGGIFRRSRPVSHVICFARPDYR